MKKCEHTLTLKNKHDKVLWERTERKRKICFQFVDAIIDENLIQSEEPLMDLLKHLETRKDYGVAVLRAAVRRDEKDEV